MILSVPVVSALLGELVAGNALAGLLVGIAHLALGLVLAVAGVYLSRPYLT